MNTKWGSARLNSRGYYSISSRKEGNHDKLLHILIWESIWGKVPDGWVVHHLDGDKKNNCILNLYAMPRAEHTRIHSTNPSEERKNKRLASMKGYKHSKETKMKISKANKGKFVSEKTRRKMSKNNAKYWKFNKMSDETRQKMSDSHTKKYPRIIKKGKSQQGKPMYALIHNKNVIKRSIHYDKLEKELKELLEVLA